MKSIFYLISLCFCVLSCDNNTTDYQSIDKLITGIQRANNHELSGLRIHNNIFLNRYKDNAEQPKLNLELIDRLLELNNDTIPKFGALFQFIVDFNLVVSNDCKINGSNIVETKTNYFLLINDIVRSYCLTLGCDGNVKFDFDIVLDNSNIYAKKGELLEISIKSRPDKNYGKFEYVLFDTLNFKTVGDATGYFELDTKLFEKGEHQMQIPVFAKEIFSNRTKLVRTINMNILLY